MNEQKVIDLCGNYPTDFSKADVATNPGYVFQNDTSYSSVQLWDIVPALFLSYQNLQRNN